MDCEVAVDARPGPLTEDALVYFVHIPRTGGTSLFELLERGLGSSVSLHGGSRRRLRERLEKMSADELAPYRLVSGHLDTSVTRLLGRRPRFVTMLREPAARTISVYEIIKRMPDHHLHSEIVHGRLSFLDYLAHPRGGQLERDRQVRQIAGVIDAPFEGESDDLLELAWGKLVDEFAFFGIKERYEESVELLSWTFRWPHLGPIPHFNPSLAYTHAERLSPGETAAARELNRLDRELYARARNVFLERVQIARKDAEVVIGSAPRL